MKTIDLYYPLSLAEQPLLSTEVRNKVKAADWQTFIVAMTVLIGGGWLLTASSVNSDVRLAAAGFIGAVVSYFFGAKISTTSAAATIAASQSGSASSNLSSAQGAAQSTTTNGAPKP